MMKKLQVTFNGVADATGYLHTFAKCLSAALQNSPYREKSEDIVAASGFAFRMWVDGRTLCPSAGSLWEFAKQKPWAENGGLTCSYVQRLWDEPHLRQARREEALRLIRSSIDSGCAAVAWDIGGGEWGLIIGYEGDILFTLKPDGTETVLSCKKLGELDIPILSVLTVTGIREKEAAQLVRDTKKLAASHLRGEEWCENACGLAAYGALITFVKERFTPDADRELTYCLGTFAALKEHAWHFFEKHGENALALLYRQIYESWLQAFTLQNSDAPQKRQRIAALLSQAEAWERQAAALMGEE